MPFPKAQQFCESAMPQEFALPIPIMKYIWLNPTTPKVYQKLIKCCKLFFIKNPILVLKNLNTLDEGIWKHCNIKECDEIYHCNHQNEKIDINKLLAKIWVIKRFNVFTLPKSRIASAFISRIYQYKVQVLQLCNQILSYDELNFLANGVKYCVFQNNIVKYGNRDQVSSENIIKLFSGAKEVLMNFGFKTHYLLCQSYADFADACGTIEQIRLLYVPDSFSVQSFYQHLKRNKNYSLIDICPSSSHPATFDVIIDEILGTKTFKFVPPVIHYYGQNGTKLIKMKEIQEREAARRQH